MTYQGVSALINIYFNVVANAAMGVSNTITNTVNSFVTNFQVAFNPQITKYYVKRDTEKLNKLALRASRYSGFLVLIFLVPICLEIKNVLTVWLGVYPVYAPEFCVLTLMDIYIGAVAAPLWMILCSDVHIRSYQMAISAVISLNFLGSWILLSCGLPPYIVVAVRIGVNVLAVTVRLVMVKRRIASFETGRWLMDVAVWPLCMMVVPAAVGYGLSLCRYASVWGELVSVAGVSAVLMAGFIFVIGLTKEEKLLVKGKVEKVLGCRCTKN
jgi:O-antigen/teichoic acid export membrane protein